MERLLPSFAKSGTRLSLCEGEGCLMQLQPYLERKELHPMAKLSQQPKVFWRLSDVTALPYLPSYES
ncbi:hypothetical protein X975_26307, partial [Stegodyphus mimosarum]